jgi:RNA polymerase sigma factor (sigma-70 family)
MANEIDTGGRNRITDAYEKHYDLLRFIAGQRFKIPVSEIRPLIHDVFVAFMRHERSIGEPRRWLTTAVGNACRNYWRDLKPGAPLPAELLDPRELADDALARLDLALLFAHLSAKCRAVLRLRYMEGLAPPEIAERFATSPGYVRLKVHRCLEAAKRTLAGLA